MVVSSAAHSGTGPSLYVVGDRDLLLGFPGMDKLMAGLPQQLTDFRGTVLLDGVGHRTQQEQPTLMTEAMRGFLHSLDG